MKVHLMGIGGTGVSSLALVLLRRGDEVSGCDAQASATTEQLAKAGARIAIGHDAAHVAGQDLVVHSAAIPATQEELVAARDAEIETLTRAELLAQLMRSSDAIAVAGTHGKTTTTYMLGHILTEAGYDPSVLVGDGANTRAGGSRWLVAEADESDGSLVLHEPRYAIVTNLELDHPDHFTTLEAVEEVFASFLSHLPSDGLAVICAEDEKLLTLPTPARRVTYGIERGDYKWRALGFEVKVPGRHNALNACGAAALAIELGVSRDAVGRALASFKGARRRLEHVGAWREAELYDDYGHHPTEVRATVAAVRELQPKRVVLVFQPHRYSRYAHFRDDFAKALASADQVVVAEVYGAGEANPEGISSRELAGAVPGASFAADLAEVRAQVEKLVQPGDLVLFMGAGDIWKVPHQLAE